MGPVCFLCVTKNIFDLIDIQSPVKHLRWEIWERSIYNSHCIKMNYVNS